MKFSGRAKWKRTDDDDDDDDDGIGWMMKERGRRMQIARLH